MAKGMFRTVARILFVGAFIINPFLLTTTTILTNAQSTSPKPTTPQATTTTTAIPVTTTSQSAASNTTTPKSLSTAVETSTKSQEEVDQVKKIILQHIDKNHNPNRLALNKPTLAPQMVDFAPDSMEAKVSDATSQFGLQFLNNLMDSSSSGTSSKENIVMSPLSLENLLNMILLGSGEDSSTYQELFKTLGYESVGLSADNNSSAERLKPHEAMHSVFQNILSATHLTIQPPSNELLLNTNSEPIQAHAHQDEEKSQQTLSNLAGHLQTSKREGDQPLDGQLNFTLANLVLTNKDMVELNDDYEKELKKYYEVEVEEFSREVSPVKNKTKNNKQSTLPLHERVNNWVKNTTQGQIDKLVSESDLSDADLVMVLLNGAHFKGRWLHTFASQATQDGVFYNNGLEESASTVKFMRQKGPFGYADFGTASLQNDPMGGGGSIYYSDSKVSKSTDDSETLLTEDGTSTTAATTTTKSGGDKSNIPTIEMSKEDTKRMELTNRLNCSVLMLPFSINDGQELSMVILLPAKRDGLAELQSVLDSSTLNEIYKSLNEQTVQVELPKFSFDATYDAKSILLKMGLKSVFNETANLDRMFKKKKNAKASASSNSSSKPVSGAKVDKIIHKAKILIDESGAEAAAASMGSVVLRNFIRPPSPRFTADHPFLFIIRHNRSNMPLFMGVVNNL